MIHGAHFLVYSSDAERDRIFFRDVLQFPCVDAGEGWLIFKLPPAELAFHPADGDAAEALERRLAGILYLMCEDLNASLASLKARKVKCTRILETPWGRVTTFRLPSGGRIGLYQPRHPLATRLRRGKRAPSLES